MTALDPPTAPLTEPAARGDGSGDGRSGTRQRDDRLTLEQQVCFSLAVAARDVVSLYRPLLEPLGLTHPQYLVMVTLWQKDEAVTVKELSELLRLESPTLSPLLKRLQKAGLLERHRNSADERSLQVNLTTKGRALREEAVGVPAAIIARLGMTVGDLESLQEALKQVIAHADAHSRNRRAKPEQAEAELSRLS